MARLCGLVARPLPETRAAVLAAAAEQGWQVAKRSDETHVWLFTETTGFTYGSQINVLLVPEASTETRIELETHKNAPSFGNIGRGRLAARRILREVGAARA